MIKAEFKSYGSYTTDSVSQWDLNQKLTISGLDIDVAPVLAFSCFGMYESIIVQSKLSNGVITCDVPNAILQFGKNLNVDLCSETGGQYKAFEKMIIPVNRRKKPSDYLFTDNVPLSTAESIKADLEKEINCNKTYTDKVKAELKNDNKTLNERIDTILTGTVNTTKLVTVHSATIRNNSASDLTFKISSKDNETLKSIKDKSPTVIDTNVIARALDGVAINGASIPSSYNVESTNDEYVITVYSGSSSVVGSYVFMAVATIAYKDTATDISSAELKDIRTGANGTTYPTAGDAVRGQINDLKKELDDSNLDENVSQIQKNMTDISQLKESLEIEKNHTETEYKEEVVQLEITEGQAISTDGELYSSAYARWGKASVEGLCKIKVSGRSQQNKKYPLISYFDTNDKLLGSDCGDGTAKNYVDIELTTPLRTAYVKINGAQGTSTSVGPKLTKVSQLTVKEFLNKNKNNDNPLYGKKIVCMGDSIVKGQGYNGDTKGNKSYVDMIAEKNNMTCINYAVSGATIMSGTNETVFHICDNIETMDEDADYIIVGGGYNDHIYRGTIGSLTDDYTSEITNTSRIIGGTEYMCRKLLERYEGKKILFVFSHKIKDTPYTKINDYNNGSHTMTEVHDAIESVLKKYSMPYCDLYNISCFNTAISSYLKYTANNDGTHPTKEGYEKFYVPYVEAKLKLL